MGMPVAERDVDRTEVYMADEAFLCGSAWEIMPVASLDRLPVGDGGVGPVTRELQNLFFKVVRGRHEKYREWITPIYGN